MVVLLRPSVSCPLTAAGHNALEVHHVRVWQQAVNTVNTEPVGDARAGEVGTAARTGAA